MIFLELNITDKKEEKLLSRLKVEGKLKFEGSSTPSNDQVRELIAKNLGKDAKLVVVKNIYTKYGAASADVLAYVYDNERKLKELEKVNKKSKEKKKEDDPKEKAKPEALKEEAKPEEKPAEEKKKEVKEEPKEEKAPVEEKK